MAAASPARLRVGVVTTSYPREAGDPAGSFVAGFSEWLAAQPSVASVEVVAAGPGACRVGGLPVARLDGGGLFYRGGAPDALAARGLAGARAWAAAGWFQARLAALVARRAAGWDAAVSHWVVPSALAVEAGRAAAVARGGGGLRHLAIAHSSDLWLLQRSKPGRQLLGWLSRRADLVYAGPHLAAAVPEAAGRMVPMAASTVEGLPASADGSPGRRHEARARLGLGPRPTALFLGRLVPVKGLDLLLPALPDGLDLVVAGDGPLRGWLAGAAAASGKAVRLLGEVRGPAKADLLSACDLLVLPSRRLADGRQEGTPTVLREALAAGLPIVATRTGGVAALLEGRPGAMLCEATEGALAATLRTLVDDPARLRRLTDEAAARSGDEHGWDRVGPQLAGSLLHAQPAGHARGGAPAA